MSVKQSKRERQEKRKRKNRLNGQRKKAAIRAKYGPRGKPAPVVVRQMNSEETKVVDQSVFQREKVSDTLEQKAKEAGFQSYRGYLRSKIWRAKRREVLNRDRWKCVRCPKKTKLQVHHRWYEPLGAESLRSLETLCESCHRSLHRR